MTTRIRNGFKGVASTAAAGLLAVLSMTAATTQASAGTIETAAWLGQIEVTAPVTRLVIKQARAVVANLGSMTVTATRLSTVADISKPAASAGETENSRNRSPRAVLVQ